MARLLIIYGEIPLGTSDVEGSKTPHKTEDTGLVSSLEMVLEAPLCLIVLQRCLCRGHRDI